MKTPKNQAELLQIIEEQEKQLRTLKQAIIRLEQVVRNVSTISNRNQGNYLRLSERMRTIDSNIRQILKG